ncbi:plasmodesmata-located protein 2-like [Rutidosis leptorrhynchoides]|uniref:plasmodesmata-located protein 2-like n=1 Tax=Rutidosis leptorrhynchoides TaxID=125765 RepID=UPI003A99F43B
MAFKPRVLPLMLINFMLLNFVSSNPSEVSHYTEFVYKKCRNETHIPQNFVSSLLQELVERSTNSKFYQTSTGDDTLAVSGMFQCQHYLTNDDCHDCIVNTVTRLSSPSSSLARIHLKGCFMSLEPEPEPEPEPEGDIDHNRVLIGVQKDYVQHKKCGERKALFDGLEEIRDVSFEIVAKCVTSSVIRYCDTTKEGLYAMGQCVGSLGECECGECVSNAFQVAQDECWGSDSGEVYLDNCFITFSDDQQPTQGGTSYSHENNVGGGSAKVAAMVVGIGVALALLFSLCYCIKSSSRKHEGEARRGNKVIDRSGPKIFRGPIFFIYTDIIGDLKSRN